MRVRIVITEGPQKGNKFNIPLPCTIGRRDADLRLRDMTVSKRHASLEAIGEKMLFFVSPPPFFSFPLIKGG